MNGHTAKIFRRVARERHDEPKRYGRDKKTGNIVVLGWKQLHKRMKRSWKNGELTARELIPTK